MKALDPCLWIIAPTVTTSLCLALPFEHFSADVLHSTWNTPLKNISGTQRRQTPILTRISRQVLLTHIRRGSGGYSTTPAALGSFQLQTKYFKSFMTLIPVTVAASYLDDFLDTIALRIETGFWSKEAPTNHRIIHMWSFELAFYSSNTAIPWDFIQAYVLQLADEIAKGFVATFEEQLTGLIGGVATAVTVKLRINSQHPPMIET